MLNKNMGKTDERNHAEALYEKYIFNQKSILMAQINLPWSLHCFKIGIPLRLETLALSVRLIDAPVTTYWLFTNTPTVKRDEVDGEDEGKRGEREKKKRAREDKLCQDSSQFHREIKLPYGFAVNRNTICHAAT